MTVTAIKARIDTFTNESFPKRNMSQRKALRIDNTTGVIKRAFIDFNLPSDLFQGANLISAYLILYPKVDAASTAGAIRLITDKWREGQTTHDNSPTTTAINEVLFSGLIWSGELVFDVTSLALDAISAGGLNGFRITTTGSSPRVFHSSEAVNNDRQPTLVIEWNRNPPPPEDLGPSGGRAVSVASPTLHWMAQSAFGDQVQSAFDLVVRNATTLANVYGTGEVISSDSFHTLISPLAADTLFEWQVRVRDGDGLWSEFSEWAQFKYISLGTVTITNPGVSGEVNDPTPPITWTYSGTQSEVAVIIYEKSPTQSGQYIERHKLSRRVYAPTSYTPPQGIIQSQESERYKVRVIVWPEEEFEHIAGAPNFAEAERVFSLIKLNSVPAPSSLSADPHDFLPAIHLSWNRDEPPDSFLLLVDDIVKGELYPENVSSGGTLYEFDYWGSISGQAQTYEIAAVVNNEMSGLNPTDSVEVSIVGIWLIDPESGKYMRIRSFEPLDEVRGESGETVYPIGRPEPVRYRDSLRGLEGSVQGMLIDESFLSAVDAEAIVQAMNENMEPLRLIMPPNRNFSVHIYEVATPPNPAVLGTFFVSFIYDQIAEFNPLGGFTGAVGYSGGY